MTPRLIRAPAWGPVVLPGVALLALAVAGATLAGAPVPAWLLGAALAVLLATAGLGVVLQSSGIFARPVIAVQTPRPELALTFDDGPDPLSTPLILDALEAGGHRGTFFVIGERAARHPELVAEIARRGHGLANHSFHHSYLTNLLAPARLASELRQTSALIERASGHVPRWFRPPVGLLSPRVAVGTRLAELDLMAWTASARDGVPSRTVESAVARLRPHLRPGAVLVLHDGAIKAGRAPIALEVLRSILQQLQAAGLRSVSVDQLLAAESVLRTPAPARSP